VDKSGAGNVNADRIINRLNASILQHLSDKYVNKAENAVTPEEKRTCYNKVLYYSGLKAILEDTVD